MESLLIKPEHHDDKYREMSPSTCQLDTIHLRNLRLSAVIGPDAWNRYNKPQPIVLTIQLQIDTTAAGASDNLNDSFSYSQICKDITAKVDGKKFVDIDDLTYELTRLAGGWPGKTLKIQAMVPKGMLRVEGGFGRVLFLQRVEAQTHGLKTSNWRLGNHEWLVQGLKLACIIGVNPHERIEIQALNINLRIIGEADAANYALQIIHENYGAWRRLVKRVCEVRRGKLSSLFIRFIDSPLLSLGCRSILFRHPGGALHAHCQNRARRLPRVANHSVRGETIGATVC